MLNDKKFIIQVDSAIKTSKDLLLDYPGHKPFEILLEQLKFIKDYSSGKSNDDNKLKAVDLSYIISREVDDINHDFAEQLSAVYWEIRKYRGDNIYKM